MFFYAGFNRFNICQLLKSREQVDIVDEFTQISLKNVTNFTIGWNYILVWQGKKVYLYGKLTTVENKKLLTIPGSNIDGFCFGIAGKNVITLLTIDHEIWQYKLYEDTWIKIDDFIPRTDDAESVVKITGNHTIVALTNLGRIFNIPVLVQMPKRVKYIDVVCGFEHTLLLADNGDIYSMGIGRGQLGHGDLEDCYEPKLIKALAGLKVVQISAASWHNAIITSEGDLYVWGWNTNGELGLEGDQKVFALPTVVEFSSKSSNMCEIKITKVQCSNASTICLSDDQSIWGSGSNKYGQLGQKRQSLIHTNTFIKLETDLKKIIDINCQEWGTIINTE